MPTKWSTARIADIANVTDYVANGSFESLRKNVTYRTEPDYAVLVRLVDYNAGWSGGFTYVDRASYEFLRKSALVPGDVVISNVGANAGTVFRVPALGMNMTLGPNAVLCRPMDQGELDRGYLYYYLTSPFGQESLRSILSGSAQPKFNKTDLRRLLVPLPPICEQRDIAHILGTLDDKIELNRRMAATLEEMARAVFKSWFIDFDPVRAKSEGRPTGLPPEIDALFPDTFNKESIPTGWKIGMLAEIARLQGGFAFKSSDWVDEGIPVVKIGSVKPGLVDMSSVSYVTEGVASEASRFRLAPGDLLIGMTGYVGEVGLVPLTDNPPLLNQRVGRFVLDEPGTSLIAYIYCLTRDPEFKIQVESKSHGTAQANISADGILSVPVIVPPKTLRDQFNVLVKPIIDRILAVHAESSKCAIIRDTLLQILLNNQIDIERD
jgi:type I restriction enzyme S subunit